MFYPRTFLSLIIFIAAAHFSFADDAQKIYKKVSPSVVIIYTTDQYDHPQGQGSGVILTEDGKIITNFHVIAEAEKIQVHLNKTLLVAKIIGIDPEHDLAALKVEAKDLTPVQRNTKQIEIGEKVFAIGSPLGYENTISEGIISGRRHGEDTTMELLQITAPFSPGSSGGAVVNTKGALIGISTMNIRGTAQNINFAVPADFIDSVKLKDHITRNELLAVSKLREALSIDLQQGDVQEAIRLLNEVLRYDLLNEMAMQQLCYAYMYAGDDSHAIEYSHRLAALNPQNPTSHYVPASIYFRNGNYKEVKKEAQQMIAVKDKWTAAHCFYGRSLYLLGQRDSAEMQLHKAISLDSTDWDAHYYLACLYTDEHKYNDAINQADKSLYRNNDCYECNVLLGSLYNEKGNKDEAISYYKDAIDIKYSHPLAHLKLAQTFLDMKLYTQAAQQARIAVSQNPNYCDAYELLLFADALKPGRRIEEPLNDFRDLRNCDPAKAFAYAAYFDSAGVKEGMLLGTDMMKNADMQNNIDSITRLLNKKNEELKKAEAAQKKKQNVRSPEVFPSHPGISTYKATPEPPADTVLLGGNYYIECPYLVAFQNKPLIVFRSWIVGQAPDLDADLYDGSGTPMGSVRHGIVQHGSLINIKTKNTRGEFSVYVEGQRASTLISMKKNNPSSYGMIEITFSLCLSDGYLLRCTPYETDKRIRSFGTRNIFRGTDGIDVR